MKQLLLLIALIPVFSSNLHCSNKPSALAHSLPAPKDDKDLCALLEEDDAIGSTSSTALHTPLLSARNVHHGLASVDEDDVKKVKDWVNSLGLPNQLGSARGSVLLLASEVAAHLKKNNSELWAHISNKNGEAAIINAFKTAMKILYPNLKL